MVVKITSSTRPKIEAVYFCTLVLMETTCTILYTVPGGGGGGGGGGGWAPLDHAHCRVASDYSMYIHSVIIMVCREYNPMHQDTIISIGYTTRCR